MPCPVIQTPLALIRDNLALIRPALTFVRGGPIALDPLPACGSIGLLLR